MTSECDTLQRNFAIIGHKAPSSGDMSLNDLPGVSGRMDVIARAVNATLFLSHGIRKDSQIIIHLMGGNLGPRRVKFDGRLLSGVRPDERSISGHIKSVIKLRLPPIGIWSEVSSGIFHSGGDISTTIREWLKNEVDIKIFDIDGQKFMYKKSIKGNKIGFILSDDLPFNEEEYDKFEKFKKISVGPQWLQGHSCIAIAHHIIDSCIE